ncbi:hypothetical protein BN2475_430021 [Paraburkholderia ribeironis]|uniref:Uncharacterized protein n=1 Tax=Paraburkholderia ribeironis TaxID=1247936 RepID=A0A1N7S7W6_9BURK|nr:hypothetical protein BN2475_430021 [Paraburkholderia ribeironis]
MASAASADKITFAEVEKNGVVFRDVVFSRRLSSSSLRLQNEALAGPSDCASQPLSAILPTSAERNARRSGSPT